MRHQAATERGLDPPGGSRGIGRPTANSIGCGKGQVRTQIYFTE